MLIYLIAALSSLLQCNAAKHFHLTKLPFTVCVFWLHILYNHDFSLALFLNIFLKLLFKMKTKGPIHIQVSIIFANYSPKLWTDLILSEKWNNALRMNENLQIWKMGPCLPNLLLLSWFILWIWVFKYLLCFLVIGCICSNWKFF